MVEAGPLCIQTNVAKRAGVKVSAVSVAEAYTNVYILLAVAQLCASARYDWVTNYASISTIGKEILRDAAMGYMRVSFSSPPPWKQEASSELQRVPREGRGNQASS